MSDNIRQTPAITQNISRGITNVLGHSIRNPAYHPDLTGREKPDQHPMEAITGLQSALDTKQDVIQDLDTIRSGAAAGATALQAGDNISLLTNDACYTKVIIRRL